MQVSTETEQRFLRGWMTSFPPYEWKWVKDAILCPSSTYGLEVKAGQDLQDWYHPPSYNPVSQQKPSLANFFGKSIFIWMPLKRWGVVYHCVKCKEKMKGAGTCRTVRQVLDVDRYYVMVTENVRCPNKRCGWSPPGWHLDLMKQLPLEYSRKFPAVLTSMLVISFTYLPIRSFVHRKKIIASCGIRTRDARVAGSYSTSIKDTLLMHLIFFIFAIFLLQTILYNHMHFCE